MAQKRDSGWVWITLAAIGRVTIAALLAMRILAMLAGPDYALHDIPSRSMYPNVQR